MSRRNTVTSAGLLATQEMRSAVALVGAGGFAATDYYSTSAGGGEQGAAAGFWVFALVSFSSKTGNRDILSTYDGAGGYVLGTATSGTTVALYATNGVGGVITSPTYTIQDSDLGKICGVFAQHTGSVLELYVNRAKVSTNTAITGYTAGSAACFIGNRPGLSFPASNMTIYGCSAGRGSKTLAQIQALFDDAKLLRDVAGSGLLPTNAWSLKRAGGSAPPASLANLIGTDAMTRAGSALSYAVTPAPVWGW